MECHREYDNLKRQNYSIQDEIQKQKVDKENLKQTFANEKRETNIKISEYEKKISECKKMEDKCKSIQAANIQMISDFNNQHEENSKYQKKYNESEIKLQELNDTIKGFEIKLSEKSEEVKKYQEQIQNFEQLAKDNKGEDGLREKYENIKNSLQEKLQQIELMKQQKGDMAKPADNTQYNELKMKYDRLKVELRKQKDSENTSKSIISPKDNNDVVALKKEFQKIIENYKAQLKKKSGDLLFLKSNENINDKYSVKLQNLEKMLENVNNQLDIARENNKRLLKNNSINRENNHKLLNNNRSLNKEIERRDMRKSLKKELKEKLKVKKRTIKKKRKKKRGGSNSLKKKEFTKLLQTL